MSDAIESSVAIDKIIELAEQSIKFHQSLPPRPIFTSPPRGLQLSNEPVTPEAAQSGSNISSNPLDNIETTAPQHFPLASSTPRQNIGNISPPQPSTSSTIASPQNPVDTTMRKLNCFITCL